jgi:hypothetical protein
MIIVTFIKPVQPYNPGERANFSEAEARRLIESGSAIAFVKASVEPEPVSVAPVAAEPTAPVVTEPTQHTEPRRTRK